MCSVSAPGEARDVGVRLGGLLNCKNNSGIFVSGPELSNQAASWARRGRQYLGFWAILSILLSRIR
ncbi:hypothetical protein JMJ77_0006941 [Colletotrichum scovillei]|uniref:Uncharacterized protein n=1 Tax=Colletotrichum scovillei TaxID=1209932 RepID=A0A9P7UIE0_9PEZI|nr:hypothetical protein JMJ77_0006941 [Colletotrichum scovillei]KAG7073901.1 hypothetical protein JMJ76_0010396 [Colletotrichum scovillei]KAG7081448.1 hypothetical protein JMJ78_0003571 [Colletotrichum scovillei]